MSVQNQPDAIRRRIRVLLVVCLIGVLFSGVTAIPLEPELKLAAGVVSSMPSLASSGFALWIAKVRDALVDTYGRYPFIAYGTDWLAFAHFVIAIALIGPIRDPVRNVWVVEFAMIACVLIVPFALIAGGFRGVPLGWRLIDCCFGLGGLIPLSLCRRYIKQIEMSR